MDKREETAEALHPILKPLAPATIAVFAAWFGMMRAGRDSRLRFGMVQSKPSPQAETALAELVAAGALEREDERFGAIVYRPKIDGQTAMHWLWVRDDDPELRIPLTAPIEPKREVPKRSREATMTIAMRSRKGGRMTRQDRVILTALAEAGDQAAAGTVARLAKIKTHSPTETAARHCIKLTKAGLAEKMGTRMFPSWRITPAGRVALEREDGR